MIPVNSSAISELPVDIFVVSYVIVCVDFVLSVDMSLLTFVIVPTIFMSLDFTVTYCCSTTQEAKTRH